MPIIVGNPSSNQPIGAPDQSTFALRRKQLITGALDLAQSMTNTIRPIAGVFGLGKPEVIDLSGNIKPPYAGFVDPAEASVLRIYGKVIPDGIALTHCTVHERIDYHVIPNSALAYVPLQAGLNYQYKAETETVPGVSASDSGKIIPNDNNTAKVKTTVATNASPFVKKMDPYSDPHLTNINKMLDRVATKNAGSKTGTIGQVIVDSPAIQEELKRTSTLQSRKTLSERYQKSYMEDSLPRTAELRFVLHDVLSQEGTSLKLVNSRYALLEILRGLFCKNANGPKMPNDDGSILSMAAKINFKNASGRIVQLSSLGLDLYDVDSWITVDFTHIEVPDHDVIAVRVQLSEYESVETSAKSSDAADSRAASVQPTQLTRPSYDPLA